MSYGLMLVYRYGSVTYALAPGDSLLLHGTVQRGPESFTRLPIRLLSTTLTRSTEAIEPWGAFGRSTCLAVATRRDFRHWSQRS